MRLKILNSGYGFGTKVLFAFIHTVSRHPVPDAAKLVFYRPDFYGAPMKEFTHLAMRGPSAWSVGDRELMAAFVSKINACAFCIAAHTAAAARAYHDEAKVSAVLSDLETASIEEPLRATLRMLGKLTREHTVDAGDMREVLAAGVSREQIEDALAVCMAFNTTDRLPASLCLSSGIWTSRSLVCKPSQTRPAEVRSQAQPMFIRITVRHGHHVSSCRKLLHTSFSA